MSETREPYVTQADLEEADALLTGSPLTEKEFLAWEASTHDVIDFKKSYVDIAGGDVIAGLVLSVLVYWHLPTVDGKSRLRVLDKKGNFWVAAQRPEWWERARVSPRQLDKAVNTLVKNGVVAKMTKRFNGVPTLHLRIIWKVFLSEMNNVLNHPLKTPPIKHRKAKKPEDEQKSEQTLVNHYLVIPESLNSDSGITKLGSPLTETTTESTTENTRERAPEKSTSPSLQPLEKIVTQKEAGSEEKSEALKAPPHPPIASAPFSPVLLSSAPHTAEEARARTQAAIARGAARYVGNSAKFPIIDLSFVPENLMPLAEAFVERFGRGPTRSERSFWLKGWTEQSALGVTPQDIADGYTKMVAQGLTIKWPGSVNTYADEAHRNRMAQKVQKPDGLKAATQQLFAEQDEFKRRMSDPAEQKRMDEAIAESNRKRAERFQLKQAAKA